MDQATLGMGATLRPIGRRGTARRRPQDVRSIRIPGLGRIAFSRDLGEAGLFSHIQLQTKLRTRHLSPSGDLIADTDHGSGLVTNVGVLALCQDGLLTVGPSAAPANLFSNLKFHAWGKSATAATTKDIKLNEAEKPTEQAGNAVEGTNTLSAAANLGEGEPKLTSKAKIKAESSFEVKEWGIFTQKALQATTGTPLTAETATSGKVTGTPLTASSTTVKGETLKILAAAEASEIWGLITANSTSEVTVPGWYKQSTGAKTEPSATSAYKLLPVMFDHRVISTISVESGNEIEFIWELTLKSGG